ncbi:MAG: serine/threonine-protein kinase [Kofleriaceae bacterium]
MTACPTDDELGALVQQALDEAAVARVTTHIDACETCRQVVIAAVRGGVAVAPATIAIGTPTLDRRGDADASGPAPGSKLGRYELRELLGAGGMGRVYAAYDAELDRSIALKIMRPELAAISGRLAERLVRESRIMAKLAHPSLITVYDVGRFGEAVFIAMELIRGETLGAYVRRTRPPWRAIIGLLERAGHGLAAAHDAGIIHRDFKPDNVLVSSDGVQVKRVVVTDFGVARAHGEHDDQPGSARRPSVVELTATGVTVGTPAYMAPEQLDGLEVDRRADVFAFAVSAWELVFGERPFAGRTVEAIRDAMHDPPPIPKSAVPDRIVRVLQRGLALAPADRWPDMPSFQRALAAPPRRRRAVAVGAIAIALVSGGIAGAQAFDEAAPVDPCLRGEQWLAPAYDARVSTLEGRLGGDRHAAAVLGSLAKAANTWRETHRATCKSDRQPPQPANVAACLDARKLELTAVVDDLILDGPRHANMVAELAAPATSCASPAPAYLVARVPSDHALRRRVTELRHRAFDAEAARNRGDFQGVIAQMTALAAEAATIWPILHAETLYLLGTALSQGGDATRGIATMREAAALAERVHHGYIAANAWIQLVQDATSDERDPARAMEYVAYADAAVERIGRPILTATLFEYSKGAALLAADRKQEGEAAFRRALALARSGAPQLMAEMIQGLGYVFEDQARFAEAAASYRDALVELAKQPTPSPQTEITFRTRLAYCLAMLDDPAAEPEGRQARDQATRVLGADNLDRTVAQIGYAQVLQRLGRLDEALVEVRVATTAVGKIAGKTTEGYGEALYAEADILSDLGRYREASVQFKRACDLLGDGELDSSIHAACEIRQAHAWSRLGRHADALALIDGSLELLEGTYGVVHLEVANAYLVRGMTRHALRRDAEAALDLELARAIFTEYFNDAGSIAASELALGQALWKTEPARARELIEQAVKRFPPLSAWNTTRREAIAWLAGHRT